MTQPESACILDTTDLLLIAQDTQRAGGDLLSMVQAGRRCRVRLRRVRGRFACVATGLDRRRISRRKRRRGLKPASHNQALPVATMSARRRFQGLRHDASHGVGSKNSRSVPAESEL